MSSESTPPDKTVTHRSPVALAALADALRSRVDIFGKTLAAFATLGTGAVGLSKIGDLFPVSGPMGVFWLVLAVGGLLAAAYAALSVALGLMGVSMPVVLQVDLDDSDLTSDAERESAKKIYRSVAARFGYTSLVALQERERGLRKAATRARGEEERARRTALADEVKEAIDEAVARAHLATVRRKATEAVSGDKAKIYYIVVAVGLVLFALGADAAVSRRTDAVSVAKACGEAREAGASEAELNRSVCEEDEDSNADEESATTADEARTDLIEQLVAVLTACRGQASTGGTGESRPLEPATCRPIGRVIAALTDQ